MHSIVTAPKRLSSVMVLDEPVYVAESEELEEWVRGGVWAE